MPSGFPIMRLDVQLAVAATIVTPACGGRSTTAPSTSALHAEMSDPSGDAVAPTGIATPPDLIHGTVDVSGGPSTFNSPPTVLIANQPERRSKSILIKMQRPGYEATRFGLRSYRRRMRCSEFRTCCARKRRAREPPHHRQRHDRSFQRVWMDIWHPQWFWALE
jgi:hypothetical protein